MSRLKQLKDKVEVDSLILGLASVTLATVVFFIFSDGSLFEHENKDSLTPVGQFSTSQNDVRRRVDAGLTWTPVSSSAPVYEGDSVFTGEDSTAGVTLENGSQLLIDPNSLVVIRTSNKVVEIDLQYGQLVGKVEADKPILIKQQDGEYKALEATNAEVRISQSGKSKDTQIQVVKGEVRIRPEKKREKNEKASSLKTRLTSLFKTEDPGDETSSTKPASSKPRVKGSVREEKVQIVRQNEVVKLESKPAPLPAASETSAASTDSASELDTHETTMAKTSEITSKIQLIAPEAENKLWLRPDAEVTFQWSTTGSGSETKSYRLELARDEDFLQPIYSKDVRGDSFALAGKERPEGSFYWRVIPSEEAMKKGLKASEARHLSLYTNAPPALAEIHTDSGSLVVDTHNGEQGKPVPLVWTDKSGASAYSVEISRDENFSDVVVSKEVTSPSIETPPLPVGAYHWRVKGRRPDRPDSPWSQASRFEIKEAPKPLIAPVLKNTQLSYAIPAPVLNRLPATVIASGGGVRPEKITPISWEPVIGAMAYDVEISKNADFEGEPTTVSVGDATNFQPEEVRPGPLYMRVRAKASDGRMGPPSSAARLDVTIPPPRLSEIPPEVSKFRTEKELANGRHEFKITWSPRPFAESYELEWGADLGFKRSKKVQVRGTSHSLEVSKPMEYAARVRALASDGTPISSYSEPQPALYKKELLPPPPAPIAVPAQAEAQLIRSKKHANPLIPQLREPASSTSLVSIGDSPVYVNFKWRKVSGAKSYTLQLSTDPSFTTVVSEHEAKGDSFFLNKKLPEGSVYWRVRSNLRANPGPAEWSEPFHINVTYH